MMFFTVCHIVFCFIYYFAETVSVENSINHVLIIIKFTISKHVTLCSMSLM